MAAMKYVPHSTNELIFGSQAKTPNPTADGDGKKKNDGDGKPGGDDGGKDIEPKDFIWDQFLKYLATAIALLTALDVTVQFLRGGGLSCFVPAEFDNNSGSTRDVSRDQAAYVNTFCLGSLSRGEYYSIFILIQGIFLIAPNYLWAALFGGQFDFFFGLVSKLDRLRSRTTGEYKPKNFELVHKLENELSETWKWFGIFPLYIAKLALQLVVAILAIILNASLFPQSDFSFVFNCPRSFSIENSTRPDGWDLDFTVECVYPSFRILSKIQIANYILLVLFALTTMYGLLWCFKRHKNALGYKEIARFAFSSSLCPEAFVFPKLWKQPLSPGIRSDLDFLLMRLYRADSGHGQVFKDILVDRELKRHVHEDHELLHLISEQIKDQFVHKKLAKRDTDALGQGPPRERDIKKAFFAAGFNPSVRLRKPIGQPNADHSIAEPLLGKEKLGNYEWESVAGIRDRLYGFLQFGPEKNDRAYDICFGTIGYSLILARAFKTVITVNFHPFYRNEEEVAQKKRFHTNYVTVTLQENIFSQKSEDLLKFDEAVDSEFCPTPLEDLLPEEEYIQPAQFIVVGPFTDKAKRATVNLHLERLSGAEYFDEDAVLLTVRPLAIEGVNVSETFCKFEPPEQLFSAEDKNDKVHEELNKYNIKHDKRGDSNCIPVKCGDTHCMFEFVLYKYVAEPLPTPSSSPSPSPEAQDDATDHEGAPSPPQAISPTPVPSTNPGCIALVLPGSMFPPQSPLQAGDIERFLSGDAAIQLSVVRGLKFAISSDNPALAMHPQTERRSNGRRKAARGKMQNGQAPNKPTNVEREREKKVQRRDHSNGGVQASSGDGTTSSQENQVETHLPPRTSTGPSNHLKTTFL